MNATRITRKLVLLAGAAILATVLFAGEARADWGNNGGGSRAQSYTAHNGGDRHSGGFDRDDRWNSRTRTYWAPSRDYRPAPIPFRGYDRNRNFRDDRGCVRPFGGSSIQINVVID